jgi:hypothetical protein
MKRLTVLVPLVLLLVSGEMHAQVKCTIPCWEQSFLYQFCPLSTTTVVLGCSNDPNDDLSLGGTNLTLSAFKTALRAKIKRIVNPLGQVMLLENWNSKKLFFGNSEGSDHNLFQG